MTFFSPRAVKTCTVRQHRDKAKPWLPVARHAHCFSPYLHTRGTFARNSPSTFPGGEYRHTQ